MTGLDIPGTRTCVGLCSSATSFSSRSCCASPCCATRARSTTTSGVSSSQAVSFHLCFYPTVFVCVLFHETSFAVVVCSTIAVLTEDLIISTCSPFLFCSVVITNHQARSSPTSCRTRRLRGCRNACGRRSSLSQRFQSLQVSHESLKRTSMGGSVSLTVLSRTKRRSLVDGRTTSTRSRSCS